MPPVRADAEQLLQVFLNLSLNALQAIPPAGAPGKLFISTGLRRATRRGAAAAFLEIRFRDTGVGIPPGDLKNLFIPFFTTKDKGTGLGLPISQRIIENHGGTIEVRSQPGEGATFTVLLPVEADAYAAYLEATAATPRPRRTPPPPPGARSRRRCPRPRRPAVPAGGHRDLRRPPRPARSRRTAASARANEVSCGRRDPAVADVETRPRRRRRAEHAPRARGDPAPRGLRRRHRRQRPRRARRHETRATSTPSSPTSRCRGSTAWGCSSSSPPTTPTSRSS